MCCIDSSGSGSAPLEAEGALQGAAVRSSVPILPNSCLLCCILQIANEILPKAREEILEDRQIPAEAPQRGAQVGQTNPGLLCSGEAGTYAATLCRGRHVREAATGACSIHCAKAS